MNEMEKTRAPPMGMDSAGRVRALTQRLEQRLVSRIESVATSEGEHSGKVTAYFGELLGEYDSNLQRRFSGMDARIDACSAQGHRLAEIERALAFTRVQSALAPSQSGTEWDRQPFLHILRLNTAAHGGESGRRRGCRHLVRRARHRLSAAASCCSRACW